MILSLLAGCLGLDALWRWRHRRRLLVLMYHGVVAEPLVPFCWHQLPIAAFRRQMRWVAKHYRVLPLGDALARRAEGTLPERACAITFDDGFRNVGTRAADVLRELDLPATVFLVTDLVGTERVPWPDRLWLAFRETSKPTIDLDALGLGTRPIDTPRAKAAALADALDVLKATPRDEKDRLAQAIVESLGVVEPLAPGPFALLDWDEVGALAAEGSIDFGPHSRTHEILSRCEDDEVERQIGGSAEALADRLGRAAKVFAYPNGDLCDFDGRAKAAVRASGLEWAVSTDAGLIGPDADDLALPRVAVGADLPFAAFRWLCARSPRRRPNRR